MDGDSKVFDGIDEVIEQARRGGVQWVPHVDIPDITGVSSALNVQEGGDHYKKLGLYQPWEVAFHQMTAEELKGAMKLTVQSYLAREADKGGMGDIRKACHTMQIYLELEDRRKANAAARSDAGDGGQ